ncbi:MAG: PLP-dependent aminotransferase family protein [Clostridia bacterium]|nr:PLP-dependent aminotransferase family protein [Clostridia bacterium]
MDYKFSNKLANLKPSAIREIFKNLTDPSVISFGGGNPSPESFPVAELKELAKGIFEKDSSVALQYSITEGYTPLREVLKARVKDKFSIGRDFDDTIIVSGGQQGIELACKTFCNEGDVVLCEEPSFIGALNSFRSNGARPVGVACDGEGIIPEMLEEKLKTVENVKLLYIIPTFQNPMGITTNLERRRRVYELCKQYGVMILEDNPYGELRFDGEDIPTIKSMDEEGVVIYCSSLSKILSAGMRIGYVVAPQAVTSKMVVAKQGEDVHTNIFFQMLCHKYMTECDIDEHIKKIRVIYRKKCTLMLDCLEKELPGDITFTRPKGGLFIWCTLPRGLDSAPFVKGLVEKKVAVVPGATFLSDENGKSSSFRLNYSTPSDDDIRRGVKILGEYAKEYLANN